MVAIKRQLVASTARTYGGTNGRKYITIHETANTAKGANAQAHANLQTNGFSASWHWQVDDKQAIQSFPHTAQCFHAGDGRGSGNLNSIGIEICVNSDGDFRKAVDNAAALVRKIMAEENIPLTNVVQHNRWSGKNCPTNLRNGSKGVNWAQFIAEVKGGVVKVANPKAPYDLRYGDTGVLVTALQADLNKVGYKLAVDGSFGRGTETAVKAFQRKYGLTADGIFGPASQRKLAEVLAEMAKPKPKPPAKPAPAPKADGDVYRVIVDGKQVGAYGVVANVTDAVAKALRGKAKDVRIQRV